MKKLNPILILMALMAKAIAVTGCSGDDDNPITLPSGDLRTGAMLRVAHASPNAPAVDVNAKGVAAPVVTSLKFTQATTHLNAPAVGLYVGGTMPELVDDLSFSGLSPAVQVPPAACTLDAQVVHASPGAPRDDVVFWDGMDFPPVSDFRDLGFGGASSDVGVVLPTNNRTGSGKSFGLLATDTGAFPWQTAQVMPNP